MLRVAVPTSVDCAMSQFAISDERHSDTMEIDNPRHSDGDTQLSSSANLKISTDPNGLDQASGQRKTATSGGRKRRVPDSVTPNACNNCKKARAKCDGNKPACRRCVQRQPPEPCHYDLHAKTAKEHMIREIQDLQRKNEHLEEEKESLGERNGWIEQIMRSLKHDKQEIEIISRLKRGESHKDIAEWLGRPLVGSGDQALSPTVEHQINQAIHQYHRNLVENHYTRYWTNVSAEADLIEHLVKLYFTWIHPVHMLFDQDHFLSSFKDCSDSYCSSALVNIICAMSCHLLHDTRDDDEQTQLAIEDLRTRFIKESQSTLKHTDLEKMTTIQTYAIMFLVEVGSGHGLIGASHLRLAVESLTAKQTSEQTLEAEELTGWGIMTLHTCVVRPKDALLIAGLIGSSAWSGLTYQKPFAPISTHAKPFANMDLDQMDGRWSMYRQPDDNNLELGQHNTDDRQSFATLTAREHAKLYRIAHESILVYCGARGKASADSLLDVYERYIAWKDDLPPSLRSVEGEALPHVLSLHIQYHTAIIMLLQPLLHLRHHSAESYERLVWVVVNHAKLGIQLLDLFNSVYSSFYLSPLQLFNLVNLSDAIVRYDGRGDTTPRTVEFCLTRLQEAKIGYPIAGPLQQMFRLSLTECQISISDEMERMIGASVHMGPEELLDACTRPTYKQPMSQIMPSLEEDVGIAFMDRWQQIFEGRSPEVPFGTKSGSRVPGKEKSMEIGSVLNL